MVSQDLVHKAWQLLAQHPGWDLAQVLAHRGLLTKEQVQSVRQACSLRRPNTPPKTPSNTPLSKAQSQSVELLPEDYEFLSVLGEGAFGLVLKVRHRQTQQLAVVKVLKSRDDKAQSRFRLEAKTLSRLDHPNIVQCTDFLERDGQLFLMMECIDGASLEDIVQESLRTHAQVPNFDWTAQVFEQLAQALRYCHAQGVVHRDLKPANILIESGTERLVLVDFGLTKRSEALDQTRLESLTMTGEAIGTPNYMAPEQVSSGSELGKPGPPSDVWGFAATLYFALTGQPPHQSQTLLELLSALLSKEPASPQSLDSEIPHGLNDICASCLKIDPDERPEIADLPRLFQRQSAPKEGAWSRRAPLVIMLLLSIVGLLALSVVALLRDNTPPELRLTVAEATSAKGLVTAEPRWVLSGLVLADRAVSLEVSGKAYAVPKSGQFKIELELQEGRQEFVVVAVEASGLKSAEQRVVVVRDSQKPGITDLTLSSKATPLSLSGVVSEDCELQFLAQVHRLKKGPFQCSFECPKGLTRQALRVVDRAGNESSQDLIIARTDPDHVVEHGGLARYIQSLPENTDLYLGPGRYEVSLQLSKNLRVNGHGAQETVLRHARESVVRQTGGRLIWKDLQFDGPGTPRAVYFQEKGQCVFEGCAINSRQGYCFQTPDFARGQNNGWRLDPDPPLVTPCQLWAERSQFTTHWKTAIRVSNCELRLLECLVSGWTTKGQYRPKDYEGLIQGSQCRIDLQLTVLQSGAARAVCLGGGYLNFEFCMLINNANHGLSVSNSWVRLFGVSVAANLGHGLTAALGSVIEVLDSCFINNGEPGLSSGHALSLRNLSIAELEDCFFQENELQPLISRTGSQYRLRRASFGPHGPYHPLEAMFIHSAIFDCDESTRRALRYRPLRETFSDLVKEPSKRSGDSLPDLLNQLQRHSIYSRGFDDLLRQIISRGPGVIPELVDCLLKYPAWRVINAPEFCGCSTVFLAFSDEARRHWLRLFEAENFQVQVLALRLSLLLDRTSPEFLTASESFFQNISSATLNGACSSWLWRHKPGSKVIAKKLQSLTLKTTFKESGLLFCALASAGVRTLGVVKQACDLARLPSAQGNQRTGNRMFALQVMECFGRRAEDQLPLALELLVDSDMSQRRRAIRALGAIGQGKARGLRRDLQERILENSVHERLRLSQQQGLRLAALKALPAFGEESLGFLKQQLGARSLWLRRQVVRELPGFKAASLPLLKDCLKNTELRYEALVSLGRLRELAQPLKADIVQLLTAKELVKPLSNSERVAALWALVRIDQGLAEAGEGRLEAQEQSQGLFRHHMQHSSPWVRAFACRGLSDEALESFAESESSKVTRNALRFERAKRAERRRLKAQPR